MKFPSFKAHSSCSRCAISSTSSLISSSDSRRARIELTRATCTGTLSKTVHQTLTRQSWYYLRCSVCSSRQSSPFRKLRVIPSFRKSTLKGTIKRRSQSKKSSLLHFFPASFLSSMLTWVEMSCCKCRMNTWTLTWPFSTRMPRHSRDLCALSFSQSCIGACGRDATISSQASSSRQLRASLLRRWTPMQWACLWSQYSCANNHSKKPTSEWSFHWQLSRLTLVLNNVWRSGRRYTLSRAFSGSKSQSEKLSLNNLAQPIRSWSKKCTSLAKKSRQST